ncbi:peptide chain release factor N(5)-glutamine methyltransferase [bacterium]|nr:MAG: peptide chain release factor N(5)-glutamine methyltransferase [bacterium]
MKNKNKTIGQALAKAARKLASHGIESSVQEAEILLCNAIGCKRHELFLNSEKELPATALHKFSAFTQRRLKREPLQYILGSEEFCGLDIKVTRNTLIPRPETEVLVEVAIKALSGFKEAHATVIDLCTGSGCVAIAMAKMANCIVYATDVSKEALETARENAALNDASGMITFFEGDLFAPLEGLAIKGKASAVLANPPYIKTADMETLQPEVRLYEPKAALDGGKDGLDFYRRITHEAIKWLKPDGFLIFEIGFGQADMVKEIIEKTGFREICVIKDLSGIERVVRAVK